MLIGINKECLFLWRYICEIQNETCVIEVFMPTRNSTDWNTYECYYLEKNDWFVFYPCNNAFTVISNKDFEMLYEKADECIE